MKFLFWVKLGTMYILTIYMIYRQVGFVLILLVIGQDMWRVFAFRDWVPIAIDRWLLNIRVSSSVQTMCLPTWQPGSGWSVVRHGRLVGRQTAFGPYLIAYEIPICNPIVCVNWRWLQLPDRLEEEVQVLRHSDKVMRVCGWKILACIVARLHRTY